MRAKVNPWNVVIKGLVLYFLFQLFLVLSNFNPAAINIYQSEPLIRERFPFITSPKAEDKALDVGILDTVFASHIISLPKKQDEYRVIILGDSSIWGDPLPVNYTIASQINALGLTCNSKKIIAYNLGYPLPSAIKDMMVLEKSMEYQPDLVIWGVTMYTLTTRMVEEHPLLGTESSLLASLNSRYHFINQTQPPNSPYENWVDINFRLSRTLRYQSYSLIQLATGTDQIQQEINSTNTDLTDNLDYVDMSPPNLPQKEININLVNIFHQIAGDVPVIIVNEPILITENVPNSDLRYNSYYPRWAYDQYREYMKEAADQYNWAYFDFWNDFPSSLFANSPLHLNREGEKIFANLLTPAIQENCMK